MRTVCGETYGHAFDPDFIVRPPSHPASRAQRLRIDSLA
ncbi:hypothetical protein STXM2123_5647 [Streptomyces sp. F-3]|nr:hypothetical protein STXM2123_5647 [Streptomyces sp. F-3]